MRPLFVLLVVGALGCESAPPSPTASPSASATVAAPFDYLPIEASWKKSPLKIASAVAFSRGGSALHVSLSSHPLTCADLKRGVQKVPGETAVDLTFAPLLGRDGTETWTITRARFGPVTRQGTLAPVSVKTFDPQGTIPAELDATIAFPPDELVLKGAFDIEGCGVRPWDKGAKVLPQQELKVNLAGRQLAINGATLATQRDGTRVLRVSTEPHACGSRVGSDLAVLVTLPAAGAEGEGTPTSVRAEGYALPRPIGAKDPASLGVTFTEADEATGGGAATPSSGTDGERLVLSGELSLSGYPLTIAGTVAPESCKAQ